MLRLSLAGAQVKSLTCMINLEFVNLMMSEKTLKAHQISKSGIKLMKMNVSEITKGHQGK